MSTFTNLLTQIIFSTKYREPVLIKPNREEVFKFITGILRNKKCKVLAINGVEDHIHIIATLHPTISVSSLIQDIKVSSSNHIKSKNLLPKFSAWQEGYAAFSYSPEHKNVLIKYVMNQEEHHRTKGFLEELKQLLIENEIDNDEKYSW